MTIDNEEQMLIIINAVREAETRGHPLAEHTPEETISRTQADLEHLRRVFTE